MSLVKAKNPKEELEKIARMENLLLEDEEFALRMDQLDPLAEFRKRFAYPRMSTCPVIQKDNDILVRDEECIYLSGNCLGMKPKNTNAFVMEELKKWGELGSEIFLQGNPPSALCDRQGRESLGNLLGTSSENVILMNGLSVNLNLLLLAFYQPTNDRFKILIEKDTFPSDMYAVRSQAAFRGFDPESSIIALAPREGEQTFRNEDILKVIEKEGSSIAVVSLSGVHFKTGQKLNMEIITKAAHDKGCMVAWDLAHAIGNVELRLDEWGVDFACFCTYKFLNSGSGCIGGAYLNSKHAEKDFANLMGWFSNKDSTRFDFPYFIDKARGIDAFRMTTPSNLLVACVLAGLKIFEEAGMKQILEKQFLLTGYLEFLLTQMSSEGNIQGKQLVDIITPKDPDQRGSCLSIGISKDYHKTLNELKKRGVLVTGNQPNIFRITPAPLYNSFEDVYKFCAILKEVLHLE